MTTPGAIRTKAWPIDIRPRTIKDRPLNRKDKVTTGKIPHSRIQIPRDHIHTYITSITGAQKSRYVCLEGFSYEISEPTKAVRGQKCYGLWETFWIVMLQDPSYPALSAPEMFEHYVGWSSTVLIHMRWMIIHRFHSYALDDHPKYLWKYLLLFIYLCDYWGRADIMLGFLWFLILILDVYPVPISLIDRELLLFSSCRSYEIAIKEGKRKFPSLEELL